MDAKLDGIGSKLLDLDGVWECNFHYTAGFDELANLPRQAFFTVLRGRLIGQDALGVIWSGRLWWLEDQHVCAEMLFDPRNAGEDVFVTGSDGSPRREPVQHMIKLSVVTFGDTMTLTGSLVAGPVVVGGSVKRLKVFDGPAV